MIPSTDNSKDSDSECQIMAREEQIARMREIIASMVPIIPGSVMPEEAARVSVDEIYYMSRFPVTQRWYQAIMGTNPSHWKADKILFTQRWLQAIRGSRVENHPVERVSWEDATAFCSKLNALCKETGLNELLPKGLEFALPWVAQWEYACRAGSTSRFGLMANGMGGNAHQMAWCCGNSGYNTHAVGLKEPNAWGLHDMHGNVSEWCEDGGNQGRNRRYRGGCYSDGASCCTASSGHYDEKTYRHPSIGFRVCLRRL
jgi:formylglycine-generating enzyme required for sulfatase activity